MSDKPAMHMDDRDPLPFPQAVPVLTTEIKLRDLIAAFALAGIGAAATEAGQKGIAALCYSQADAFLAERERSR